MMWRLARRQEGRDATSVSTTSYIGKNLGNEFISDGEYSQKKTTAIGIFSVADKSGTPHICVSPSAPYFSTTHIVFDYMKIYFILYCVIFDR